MNFYDCHTHKYGETCITNLPFNSNLFPTNKFSTALHPWDVSEKISLDNISFYLEKCRESRQFSAVGEIGLDKLKGKSLKVQEKYFEYQLSWANKYSLPVIIHCVRSYDRCLSILKKNELKSMIIFHDFNASFEIASELIDKGYFMSLGKNFMREKSKINSFIDKIPLEMILFETDKEEISIEGHYKKFSERAKVSIEIIDQQVTKNYQKIFTDP